MVGKNNMDWMAQLEAGIRDALTKHPVSDYWVVVHNKVQKIWGKDRAKEIVKEYQLFPDPSMADRLEFRVIKDREEREIRPIGSLIHF